LKRALYDANVQEKEKSEVQALSLLSLFLLPLIINFTHLQSLGGFFPFILFYYFLFFLNASTRRAAMLFLINKLVTIAFSSCRICPYVQRI